MSSKGSNPLVMIIIVVLLVGAGGVIMLSSDDGTSTSASNKTSGGRSGGAEDDSVAEEVRALTAQQTRFRADMEKELSDRDTRAQDIIGELKDETGDLLQQIKDLRKDSEDSSGKSDGLSKSEVMKFIDEAMSGQALDSAYNQYAVGGSKRRQNDFSSDSMVLPTNKKGVVIKDDDGFVVIKPMGESFSLMASVSDAADYTGSLLYDAGGQAKSGANQFIETAQNTEGGKFVQKNTSGKGDEGVPYMTLHIGMKGVDATAWTALVGKIGKGGKVSDPFNFTVISSGKMFGANDATLPQIEKAVWVGTAYGDPSLNCVRGNITSVTFVFDDGMIATKTAKSSEPLAELVDPRGFPCIQGTRINNLDKAMISQLFADTLTIAGEAYADSQVEQQKYSGGNKDEFVTDQSAYLAGNFAAGLGKSTADYVRYMTEGVFDLVYAQSGANVTLDIREQININYGGKDSRKVFAGSQPIMESASLD